MEISSVTHWPLLSLLIWLPILGGVCSLLAGNKRPQLARWVALAFALATFALTIPLFSGFEMGTAAMQFVEQHAWIPAYDLQYHLGVDGLSVPLIGLTTLVGVLVLVGGHVLAAVGESFHYGENLIAAMIHGRKRALDEVENKRD